MQKIIANGVYVAATNRVGIEKHSMGKLVVIFDKNHFKKKI